MYVSVLAVKLQKTHNFAWNCRFFEIYLWNATVSTETFIGNNQDVTLHYISLPIYPLHFSTFCPIEKQWKTLRNCRYFAKTTLVVYMIF